MNTNIQHSYLSYRSYDVI